MSKKILVGGQAVIEGVMMRVPGAYATAVRKPDGEIETTRTEYTPLNERYPLLKKIVLRGMIALFESFKIGFRTLQWSADIAIAAEEKARGKESKPENKFLTGLTTLFAVALALGLFVLAPLYLTTKLLAIERQALVFNLIAGGFRIVFFLLYLWIISLMKDVRRLFQYHGAEHRVVFAFERGRQLTVDNTRDFKTFHPRCGTSFIFIVLLISILMYALIDALTLWVLGTITLVIRIIFHLLLLPLVAGISYEFLKLTARHQDKPVARWLTKPGLWLQRITTQPPSDEQVETAIVALKIAFGDKFEKYVGRQYRAEAID